jgi:hypothetical protein
LVKKEDTTEPIPEIHPNGVSLAAAPRPKTTGVTPAPPQPKSVSPTFDEHNGLIDEEIIDLIKHYRGHDNGLAGHSRKRLLVLLKHYEVGKYRNGVRKLLIALQNKDTERVPIKQEPAPSETGVRIKREPNDGGIVLEKGKKRKTEIIALDE